MLGRLIRSGFSVLFLGNGRADFSVCRVRTCTER